jgi:hypothetical protein
MTANDSTPSDGESPAESTVEHLAANVEDLDPEERDLLAERLDVLANRVASDLHGLAADVREGEDPEEDVEDARTDLRRADETVRRHLGGVIGRGVSGVERDPRVEASRMTEFGEVYDVDALRDGPVEEVAQKLAADVIETRQVAERVDRHLYAGELTAVDVEDLWDCGLRLRGWAANVLAFRTGRGLSHTGEEPDVLGATEEELADGEGGR